MKTTDILLIDCTRKAFVNHSKEIYLFIIKKISYVRIPLLLPLIEINPIDFHLLWKDTIIDTLLTTPIYQFQYSFIKHRYSLTMNHQQQYSSLHGMVDQKACRREYRIDYDSENTIPLSPIAVLIPDKNSRLHWLILVANKHLYLIDIPLK